MSVARSNAARYVSTRGRAPVLGFDDALLAGLAPDGGLYMPEAWPTLDMAGLAGLDYAALAARVMAPFAQDAIDQRELEALIRDAYAGFDHQAVVPLVQIDTDTWLLELFHGPTLAFKDLALQVLGRLFDRALAARGERVTIVGATSGDTGSAAIAACRDRASMDVVILHPKGRTSDVQRRQMTTVDSANVHNIAIEGTFDDCQALVKGLFADARFRDEQRLAAINSLNWARIAAQVPYYVAAARALGAPGRAIAFAVPTGNFGDVFAGYVAARMGLPVARLVVATNTNDILARVLATGAYRRGTVVPTLAPSMDIQVASNFERLLFELVGRAGARVQALMDQLGSAGGFDLEPAALAEARALFAGHRADDAAMTATMADVHRRTGQVIDPHTACGVAAVAAAAAPPGTPVVVLATAHPAKFAAAVTGAIGQPPPVPPALADLAARPERYTVLPNDLGAVAAFIRARTARA
ncbi:MAG: threonine synthase [Alphaproteobacteria bacterium]|nr:threonine synthase [Alphaproteobacteria bacterium]